MSLLAQCWGYGPSPWIPFVWIAFWGLFIVGGALWWRRRGGWRGTASPETVLGERYAKGEVSDEEYRSRLAVLRERAR